MMLASLDDPFVIGASAIIVAALVSIALRARLNMVAFLVVNLSTILVGLILLESNSAIIVSYAAGIVALVFGYFTVMRSSTNIELPALGSRSVKALPDHIVYVIVFFAGFFGVYHLVVAGIPVFSSSIEIKRFDFTSSGLFGLPGRMYLYGIPFAWMLAAANAQARRVKWRSYIPWRVATFFLVATALMSGFKSGLLAATYTMLIAYFVISKNRMTIGSFARRFWWAFSLPVLYGVSVATSYSTYDVAGQSLWSQLIRRVTLVGAEPVKYAMDGRVSNFVENGLLNDLSYFIVKYTGGETSRMFSLERSISADIIDADPSSSAWTTPVTLGGFAEISYSLGPWVAAASMILIGIWIGRLHLGASNNVIDLTMCAVVAFGIYNWLLKGGIVYYVLNVVAVAVILVCVGAVGWIFGPRTQKTHVVNSNRYLFQTRPALK